MQKLAVCKSFSVSNLLRGKHRGCLLWRRDPFLEQVSGQRKGEMIWECAEKSWDEVRRADKSWDQLSRCEKSSEDVRRGEKRWEHIRWAYMSCGELRRVEKCENLKSRDEMRWDEKRWQKLRWDEKRWEPLWSAENSWERERRHQMGWDEMRWNNSEGMRWVEMRWDDTDCGDRGMQWAISKRSCDAMRSDEMRKDSTFERHGIRLTSQEPVATKHRRLACHL